MQITAVNQKMETFDYRNVEILSPESKRCLRQSCCA
jgi:hypothetical protein